MAILRVFILFTCSAIFIIQLMGCSAFFESNIEDETVSLVAPADDLHTNIVTQTFWWNYVEGAENYNLQIVSPGFDYIEKVVLDTNLTADKFLITLLPGIYEWRVSAYNSGYATPYTVNRLSIDSTLDLSIQQLLLNIPASNMATNNTHLQFEWCKIYSATHYHFELRKDDWDGDLVIEPVETPDDTLSVTLQEGSYIWGVKALNDISVSQFTIRKFMVDITSPGKPILTAPESGEAYSSIPIQLIWERPDAAGSSITDSVYISVDSVNFHHNIKEVHKTVNTYFNIGFAEEGDYYWGIKSIDAAGNKSQMSNIRKFSIQDQ